MDKKICVYSSSSNHVAPVYFAAAKELGRVIAQRGDTLVYGAGLVGLMGEIAKSVHSHGGHVIGVIPEALKDIEGVAYEAADELIITKSMRERKAIMEERADAFIALPGGFGTLEELMEIITLKQLKYHTKPILILNINDFYTPLLTLFEHVYQARFALEDCKALYYVTSDIEEAVRYIDSYMPDTVREKWF